MPDHARPDRPRLGSLFTGYGGPDAAVEHLLGARTVWRCDNDRAARALLDHHWPSEPNLGDITSVDRREVEPVDLLTGGFPCQPFTSMGQRSGTGDRRWLWDHILAAVDALQPGLLLFENVTGILSKPDALAAIIRSLAERGYMGAWRVVAAATTGAPHERRRVVIADARPQARPLLESAAHPVATPAVRRFWGQGQRFMNHSHTVLGDQLAVLTMRQADGIGAAMAPRSADGKHSSADRPRTRSNGD